MGIDIYTIVFGPVLNIEYLHITSMGKVENTLFAQDIEDMWDQIVNVQEKVSFRSICSPSGHL